METGYRGATVAGNPHAAFQAYRGVCYARQVQRREHGRYRIWFPLQLKGDQVDGMAVNHNISAAGMLIAVSTRLSVGAPVSVRFRMPNATDVEHELKGSIVRIEDNSADPEGMWPYRIAVAFGHIEESLIPFLEKAAREL
jgi:hypothetical protein